MDHLFVYGTLLSGLASPALAQIMNRLTFLGPATVPGVLYDLGGYPAAVPDPASEGRIRGELYAVPDSEPGLLGILDHYEGHFPDLVTQSLFRRVRQLVSRTDGGTVTAWMYVWNRPIESAAAIAGGDYRALVAAQRHTG